MKHLGDITKINWAEVEPVDCVTGGSPCQDLSVAGKRAGLAGERSGLYMEQIRCVKELREQDVRNGRSGKFIRPRYMVWENVPGAFSSNGGKDFAAVLEEAVKIAEPEAADVPVPEKGWPSAGCLYDEMGRWSVAWRVHDAQFWGVPQRRKRISLVCDFGGMSAPEVLFERKGLSGDFEQSGAEGQGVAQSVEGSVGSASECASALILPFDTTQITSPQNYSKPHYGDPCHPLAAGAHAPAVCYGISSYDSNSMKSPNPHSGFYEADTSGPKALTFQERAGKPGGGKGILIQNERTGALSTLNNQAVCVALSDVASTLRAGAGAPKHEQDFVGRLVLGPATYDATKANLVVAGLDCRNGKENGDLCGTLQSKPNGGFSYNCTHPVRVGATVRRLTPTECERLQGYPDGWTDIGEWVDSKGKKHKEADSPRYKALGNSIALPFWKWLLKRISAQYERDATLGSLFDGIGGFPLCWEQINGKGSARWASEIEEFPMAVTRKRFGEAEE